MNETHIQIELDCLYMSFFHIWKILHFSSAQAFPWAFPVSCSLSITKGGNRVKEYLSSIEDVLKEQNSSEQGLTSSDAEKRLQQYGKNKLKEGKKASLFERFK